MEFGMMGGKYGFGGDSGGAAGGGGRGGNLSGSGKGERAGRSGGVEILVENSGGVRLLNHSLERAMQAEADSPPRKAAAGIDGCFPAAGFSERISDAAAVSGLVAAPPAAARYHLAGGRVYVDVDVAKEKTAKLADGILASAEALSKQHQAEAAAVVDAKEKLLGDKDESIRELQEKLADAMAQLRVKDAAIDVQKQTIKALVTPDPSPVGNVTPGMSTGSLDVLLARRSGGEQTPLPPRLHDNQSLMISPNTNDDVFDETKAMTKQDPAADEVPYHQESLQKLFSACFNHVEEAIRKVPILDIVPKYGGRLSKDQQDIVRMLQNLIDTKKLAYNILEDEEERYGAMIGLISDMIVRDIFEKQILGNNNIMAGNAYITAFELERKAADCEHPRVNELEYRNKLALQRAICARALVRTAGFWTELISTTHSVADRIVKDLAICFPDSYTWTLTQDLHKAVGEAVRIAVRMRQESNYIEYNFPPAGTTYNSKFHIHRNSELNGQTLEEGKPTWCVRTAIMPLVKSTSFAKGKATTTVIHKAEVIVGGRDILLRETRKQR